MPESVKRVRPLAAAVVVLVLLLLPSGAYAQTVSPPPTPLAPGDGYVHTAGAAPPTFQVQMPAASGAGSVFIRVSKSPAVDWQGIIGSDQTIASVVGSPGQVGSWTPGNFGFPGYWLVTPGTYYWQAAVISCSSSSDCYQEGPVWRLTVEPAPPPPPPPPAPDPFEGLSRNPIPSTIGRRNSAMSFRVSDSRLPSQVSRSRWSALAEVTGTRWGMRYRGKTYGTPYSGDGASEVGFGNTPAGVLGVQTDLIRPLYRRGKRRCRSRVIAGRQTRVCRRGKRRLVRRELLDADLVVDTRANWTAGPARPSARQYDLETVLLHEMGHLAGNEGHVSRCRNSPMVKALDTGEWWRSPEDRHIKQLCGTATTANLQRVEHRTRRMPVVLPDGREGILVDRDLKRAAAARVGAGA